MKKLTGFLGFAMMATSLLAGCGNTQEILQIGSADERNPGPCPRAFALYEAARLVEFKDNTQRFANVGFTGEIRNVRSLCRYSATRPIEADLEVLFDVGRGPAVDGQSTARYEYFVAVTRKNIAVIEKQVFPFDVTFPEGVDRVTVSEKIDKIIIPRAAEGTSGINFEIIVGFQLTPEQRLFNAEGRRFRITAGQPDPTDPQP